MHMTPEEKAAQYKEIQLTVYTNFIKDFKQEESALTAQQDLENSGAFLEKQRDIEKREKEEVKKLEKQVFKREQQEVEEAFANANAKLLRDRISKSINEGIVKQQKALLKAQAQHEQAEAQVAKAR